MTIIFLTRRFYPQIGGVEQHVIEIGKRLVEKGHRVIVISENSSMANSKVDKRINGIDVIRIKAGEDDWIKKFRIWIQLWNLRHLFKTADVIHCHDVFFWYLPFRLFYPQKKVYTTFHGYETKFPPSKRAAFVRKISEILSYGTICVGDYIKKWYGTKPTFVTYGGVSLVQNSKFKVQNRSSKLKIILIGRLEKDIGVPVYLKVLQKLKKQKVNFSFEAYGEGSLEKSVEKFGKVFGFVKNLEKTINNSDLVFCSSYLTMLQALAVKKVVIAVYENKLKEDYLKISPFARFIYICEDADEVVEVVKSVQATSWKSNAMIENGYSWSKEQTWDKVVEVYLKLWKL